MTKEKYYHNGPSLTWQIVHELENMILRGELSEGELIYSTKYLMLRFDISDKTIQRAIGILHSREMLELVRGKGLRLAEGSLNAVQRYRTKDWRANFKLLLDDAKLLDISEGDINDIYNELVS